jgi:hypothetical protein
MSRSRRKTVKKVTFLSDGYATRSQEREELDRRYHKVAIPAVAAAMRYQDKDESKSSSKSATGARDDDQTESAA